MEGLSSQILWPHPTLEQEEESVWGLPVFWGHSYGTGDIFYQSDV